MHDIRLIALDLDGTLLTTNKELTARSYAALETAAARGIEIVPCTGRFYKAMPEPIQALPFVNYAITVNGAGVQDLRSEKTLYAAEMSTELAVEILRYLDTLPVIYDCYQGNWGWMSKEMQDKTEEFAPDIHYVRLLRNTRTPVPDLKAYLLEQQRGVQKIQFFVKDMELRQYLLETLPDRFPDTAISTSISNNIEINDTHANKGEALLALAKELGLQREQTAAFGDGLNDYSLIKEAGLGVAMANAEPQIKEAADRITESCDEDGVARVIEELLAEV